LVTETLARIYEKQGNLQKAIDAYRKLALKYPEKSAYFAALSRSLEEQLNT
jgi:tetratricopeptide (TPR) repeat protein